MTQNIGKNKGIAFEDYYRLVVAELIILGAEVNDEVGYPDEDEVKEDWENGKSHIICSSEFYKNWKDNHKITSKRKEDEKQLINDGTDISTNNDSNNDGSIINNNEEQPTEVF